MRSKWKALKETRSRWTNNVIPYKIVSNNFNDSDILEINAAIAEWQYYTCLSFKTATISDLNYISIVDGSACISDLGMTGGSQDLILNARCTVKGLILHYMGHAIGFHHEHNRPDRDDYVIIINENIPKIMMYQFKKLPWEAIETHGVPYDYTSVMHFRGTAFSANGEITILAKNPKYQNVIGHAEGLSFFDIKLANLMYNCSSRCGYVQCPKPGFVGKDCKCWCPVRRDMTRSKINSNAFTLKPLIQTTPKPMTVCSEFDQRCELFVNAGFCKTTSTVKMLCREACMAYNEEHKSTVTDCMDVMTDCAERKMRDNCFGTNEIYMRENCQSTCNFCGDFNSKLNHNRWAIKYERIQKAAYGQLLDQPSLPLCLPPLTELLTTI